MKHYINNDFLLETKTARRLYHEAASAMPIIDFHCHLPPRDIAEDKNYKSLTEVWLYGDHYKWRQMRTNGTPEKYCTGDASDFEKMEKWSEAIEYALKNPLYDWTHLELVRYFGIDKKLLNKKNARYIYDRCNEMLKSPEYSCRNLLKRMNVQTVCTTDDPTDDLGYHKKIAASDFSVNVLPTFRPDKIMKPENPAEYLKYLDKLTAVSGIKINHFDDLLKAAEKRHDYFHEAGCRISDHGITKVFSKPFTDEMAESIFQKIKKAEGQNHLQDIIDPEELEIYKSALLYHFAVMNHKKGWAQQVHFGALRDNNTRMYQKLGPDTGFDAAADYETAYDLSRFLNRLEQEDKLTKTVLYSLNPKDNHTTLTLMGCFQGTQKPGKIQYGPAWWFLDHIDGMTRHLKDLSSLSLLGRFIGMLTDSRSFLSFPRHEYFRRILCNMLGKDADKGKIPKDMKLLKKTVRNISSKNAEKYFFG